MMSELLEPSPLGVGRFPTVFRAPTGRLHRYHQAELAKPPVQSQLVDIYSSEAHRIEELEATEREVIQIVANVAVLSRAGMERLGPLSQGANQVEIDRRKDYLDNIAAFTMGTYAKRMQNGINFVDGEGIQDQLLGANIKVVVGPYGQSSDSRDGVNDPLECTRLAAEGSDFAQGIEGPDGVKTFMAFGAKGGFKKLPKEGGKYWEMLAAPNVDGLDIRKDPVVNIHRVLTELGCDPKDLSVVMLNRPDRNAEHMEGAKHLGVDLKLIEAGDFFPAMMVSSERGPDGKYQMVMGSGGGPEKMGAAAALKATGDGHLEITRYTPNRSEMWGNKVYGLTDLVTAPADSIAVVTAHITNDPFISELRGVIPGSDLVHVTIKDHRGVRHETVRANLPQLTKK